MKTWKRGESRFTEWLSKQGLWVAIRKSRALRGERVEDIEWGPFSVELKTRKTIPQYLLGWMRQAQVNCQGRTPLVLLHQDRMRVGSQLVVLTLDNFVRMLKKMQKEDNETEDHQEHVGT